MDSLLATLLVLEYICEKGSPLGVPAYGLHNEMYDRYPDLEPDRWGMIIRGAADAGLLDTTGETAGRYYKINADGRAHLERNQEVLKAFRREE